MINIRDLAIILAVALGANWLMNRFLPGRGTPEDPGTFVAVEQQEEVRPIRREVDFLDGKRPSAARETEVRTGWGHLVFSTDGGLLDRFGFDRDVGGNIQTWYTIFPSLADERERRCFLVALGEKTPYFYTFVGKEDLPETINVIYEASNNDALIRKTFAISKQHHKIDLTIDVQPLRDGVVVEPRIFYPSPVMPGAEQSDEEDAKISKATSMVVVGPSGAFEKIACANITANQGWLNPSIFGSEIRYALHVLVDDADRFVRRAYTSVGTGCQLMNILEGPSVTESRSWKMSFYMGPKDLDALHAVDSRLERTLDYTGWLGPISKLLLRILKWFYDLIPNYGFAIIVLTLLMKLLLLPFTIRAEKSMKKSAEHKKKLEYIQRRYKGDPQRLAQERAEFIRQHGMPGMGSCLPMLLQIPMFFALSGLLNNAIELHRAPFVWLSDLSAPDPLYVIPILLLLAMLARAAVADASQRLTMAMMGVVFAAFTAYWSAGLALFILVGSIFDAVSMGLLRAFRFVG